MITVVRVCLLILAIGLLFAAILFCTKANIPAAILYLAGALILATFERILHAGGGSK